MIHPLFVGNVDNDSKPFIYEPASDSGAEPVPGKKFRFIGNIIC